MAVIGQRKEYIGGVQDFFYGSKNVLLGTLVVDIYTVELCSIKSVP